MLEWSLAHCKFVPLIFFYNNCCHTLLCNSHHGQGNKILTTGNLQPHCGPFEIPTATSLMKLMITHNEVLETNAPGTGSHDSITVDAEVYVLAARTGVEYKFVAAPATRQARRNSRIWN